MQSEGQSHCVEFTVFAKEDRAETSDMPKIQRESIRTRREGLGGSDGAAALLGMNPSTLRSRMQKLGISTSRSVMYGCPTTTRNSPRKSTMGLMMCGGHQTWMELPLANCSSIFSPSSITIWTGDLRSGARISSILFVVGPVDDREGHDSLCWMYGLSTNVGRAGRSRHEHRICLVSKMRMPIRGVNVRYDHLWIQQNDDVVSEEADCVDKEFVFGQQDRAGLSDSKRGTNDRHINLTGA